MNWFTVARRSPASKIVSETLPPMDHARLGQVNSFSSVELSTPPVAERVSVRIVGRVGDSYLGVGDRHVAFRCRDIRAPLQQLRRHADRDRWRSGSHRLHWDGKAGRRPADQHGDSVLELSSQETDGDRLRLHVLQGCLRLDDRNQAIHACLVAGLRQFERFLVRLHGCVQDISGARPGPGFRNRTGPGWPVRSGVHSPDRRRSTVLRIETHVPCFEPCPKGRAPMRCQPARSRVCFAGRRPRPLRCFHSSRSQPPTFEEERDRLKDGAVVTVGKYCARASRMSARATMKFSKACLMFSFLC